MPRNDERTFEVRDRRTPPFLMVFNTLYDHYGAELGPYGLAVYVALCRHANRADQCWPSYATIAKETGMSRRKVIYEVKKMERLQIIEVKRNRHTSNVFTLLDTGAPHAPLTSAHGAPPSARRAPKQDPKTKDTPEGSNKKGEYRNYRPDEYADIILG
jgi:hypothetical protein